MIVSDEKIKKLKIYFGKLSKLIREEATMKLIATSLIPKARVDDLLCCIDANFPKEFRQFVKTHGKKQLKSYEYYLDLVKTIKKRCIFGDYYRINHGQSIQMIELIVSYLAQDKKYIEANT